MKKKEQKRVELNVAQKRARSPSSERSVVSRLAAGHIKSKFHENCPGGEIPFTHIKADPVLDRDGEEVYEAKHRKPKWVKPSELERFKKFEDHGLSQENSRNNRIRMEDPFAREPDNKYVFNHIQSHEICKYIMGVQYLEKDVLDDGRVVKIHPELATLRLFFRNFVHDGFKFSKLEFSEQYTREDKAKVEEDLEVFGLPDPHLDLKKDLQHTWIPNFRKTIAHKEFRKCWLKRR